jgi:acyl-CoA thioesterase FadM
VVSLKLDYRAPARLDDELEISCRPCAEGCASLCSLHSIHRAPAAPQLPVDAAVRVTRPDVRSFRPKRLPDFLISALRAEAEI